MARWLATFCAGAETVEAEECVVRPMLPLLPLLVLPLALMRQAAVCQQTPLDLRLAQQARAQEGIRGR